MVKANDKNWADVGRNIVIKDALNSFLEKRRVKTTERFEEPTTKIQKLDANNCSESVEEGGEADDLDDFIEEELVD